MRKILLVISFLFLSMVSYGQRWSLSTNLIDYADFGTMNLEGSYAVARHWSIDGEWEYNPWTFRKGTDGQFQNRSLAYALGTRWWPWHVYAGWWVRGSARYEIYNHGGLLSSGSEEGTAYGAGLSVGYALLMGEWFNIDFGFGLWGGMKDYTTYRCTSCGRITDSGRKWFVMPNDIMVTLTFIF